MADRRFRERTRFRIATAILLGTALLVPLIGVGDLLAEDFTVLASGLGLAARSDGFERLARECPVPPAALHCQRVDFERGPPLAA